MNFVDVVAWGAMVCSGLLAMQCIKLDRRIKTLETVHRLDAEDVLELEKEGGV